MATVVTKKTHTLNGIIIKVVLDEHVLKAVRLVEASSGN